MAREVEVDRLRRISEAFDGEGEMPTDLEPDEAAFVEAASRVRSALRVEEAAVPPDVTAAVLEQTAQPPPSSVAPWRRTLLVAAAVFVVAALTAALLVRPGGPAGEEVALADVGDLVVAAQHGVAALDARLEVTEWGAHPDVPVRRYEGTLRYRAPERLWLHLDDRSRLPAGWPTNVVDVLVDDGTAWSRGLHGCPIVEQPSCLGGPVTRTLTGLAPFAPDWIAPLDLVVPADGFLPSARGTTASSARDDAVVLDLTVARLHRLVDGLRAAGALRAVHATDLVRLELDPDAYTIRRLTVTASDSPARSAWAATNGYRERPGTKVLDLVVEPQALPASPFPEAPAAPQVDAGFRDAGDLTGPAPARLPDGFSAHRSGRLAGSGPVTEIHSWSNGRAWIRVDVTTEWRATSLFGDLGPLVRPVRVGAGTGWTDPTGSVVALHTDTADIAVRGSIPLDQLVAVAASIPVIGGDLPDGWPQGDAVTALPEGALRPPGPLTARYDGPDLLVAVPGPGNTSAVLRQRLGDIADPPPKADVIEVDVRGRRGRYAPRLGTLLWVEAGWVRELQSDGLDLAGLVAAAGALTR